MSLIIALKDDSGVIHMIADTQSTKGSMRQNELCTSNYKIFEPPGIPNTLIGIVGLSKINTLMKGHTFIAKDYENLSFNAVVLNFVPEIIKIFEEAGIKGYKENDGDASFLLAQGSKLFNINDSLIVTEIDDYMTLGFGNEIAYGVLSTNTHLPPKERIIQAIKVVASIRYGVSGPFVYINTKDLEYIHINAEEKA